MTDAASRPGDPGLAAQGILPGVDVIIPCYNYGRFLRACVSSVLDQPGCRVRVLIIDDCSADDSLETARAIAAGDARVQVIAHAMNRGHIATYNEGIEWLAAEYMLLLSSDDMLAPGALARAVGLMEAEPGIAFVHGPAIQFGDEADLAAKLGATPSRSETGTITRGPDFIRGLCARPVNTIETATAIVRTTLQKQVGGYRPELPHSGDMEMWLRLAAHGDVGEVGALQAYTRIHARNMRHGYKADRMRADYEQRHRAFRIFFEGQSARLADAAGLDRLACRSLAEEVLWSVAKHLEEAEEDAATARLMDLAPVIDPTIRRTPLWWKTVARRLAGPLWWRRLVSVASALGRGGRASPRVGSRQDA